MQKFLSLFLAVLLILSVGMMALAETDFGVNQDYSGTTYLRLDTEVFAFQIPMETNIDEFDLGAKIPTGFFDLYGVGFLNTSYDSDSEKFSLDPLEVGLGYPLKLGNFPLTIRSELLIEAPEWSDTSTYKIEPFLGFQFRFGGIFNQKTESSVQTEYGKMTEVDYGGGRTKVDLEEE